MNDEFFQKLRDDIADIKTSQKVMERDIAHHIKRTELAEEAIRLVREEIKPVKKHVVMMEGALKLLGVLSVGIGIVVSIAKLLGY